MQKTGNRKQKIARSLLPVLFMVTVCGAVRAQEIQLGPARPGANKNHVTMLTDMVAIDAGKSSVIELRFKVEDGFHINSHSPKDGLLIPTVLKLSSGDLQVVGVEYQPGTPFRLMGTKGTVLDVYQGEFRIKVRVMAPKGDWTLMGLMHYQACDDAACFPARSFPVMMAVAAK